MATVGTSPDARAGVVLACQRIWVVVVELQSQVARGVGSKWQRGNLGCLPGTHIGRQHLQQHQQQEMPGTAEEVHILGADAPRMRQQQPTMS